MPSSVGRACTRTPARPCALRTKPRAFMRQDWVIEAKPGDEPNVDPFEARSEARKKKPTKQKGAETEARTRATAREAEVKKKKLFKECKHTRRTSNSNDDDYEAALAHFQ